MLVVDASQGIEAQTLANTYLAVDSGLEIVPVVNKIDLPSADPDKVIKEIEDVIGIPAEDAPRISAKAGINIHDVMEKNCFRCSGSNRRYKCSVTCPYF